jgi:CHAT domain-containing protein
MKEGRPFTHLHILAHGCAIGQGFKRRFGLAMHDDADVGKMNAVAPEQLRRRLATIAEHLVVVTLAACDGGNQANSIAGGGSIAHELHSSGIPVVVASQFPLTFAGSAVFTGIFYRDMLAGDDVRDALHATRSALYQHADIGHDWAGLVAYVQIPEDDDRLVKVGLEAEMASLSTAQLWSDHLTVNHVRDQGFAKVVGGV